MNRSKKTLIAFALAFVLLESIVVLLSLYENSSVGSLAFGAVFFFKVAFAAVFIFLSLFFIYKSRMSALELREQIDKSSQMSDNLRAINKNFYGVLNTINAIVLINDYKKNEVIYANNYAIAKFGEVVGRPSLISQPNSTDSSTKKENSYEYYSETTQEWYAVTEKMTSWMDGRSVKVTICLDITDRKVAEEQLREINEHLEDRIEDAVGEIRKKDKLLVQQSKMSAMGEMIGAIAHQWRQPLNALGIVVQDFKVAYQLDELNSEYVDRMNSEAMGQIRHMSKTIDDFRNFFRPDKPRAEFVLQNSIVDVLNIISTQFASAKIKIETRFDTKPIVVDGYENEFKQVVLNLMSNAKDAILEKSFTDGKGKVVVGVHGDESVGIVSVLDNGGGIKDTVIERIFEPYFTTKEHGKGTGIGLYMSRMIIEDNMGGTILASNIGDGVEFRIELAIARHGEGK